MLCEKSKSLKFSGGVANVLGPPAESRLSKYLIRRYITPSSRGTRGGGPPPTLQNGQTKQLPKTKRLTEANRMNNKGPHGGGVLVHIELFSHELSEGGVVGVLFIFGYIGIVLSGHCS